MVKKSLLNSNDVFRVMRIVCEEYPNLNCEGIGKEVENTYCITCDNGMYRVFYGIVEFGTYASYYDAFKEFIDLQTKDYKFAEEMENRLKSTEKSIIKTADFLSKYAKITRKDNE